MRSLTALLGVIVALVAMTFPQSAASEEQTTCPEGVPRGTICIEEIEIFGDTHEPNAVFVINRGRLDYRTHHDDQSFSDEVVESVERDPF